MEADEISVVNKRIYKGPNVHAFFPVIEAELDIGEFVDTYSDENIKALLVRLFPDLKNHTCSIGREGGFLEILDKGTNPPHVIEHMALAIQNMAGDDVSFSNSRRESGSTYRLVFEYRYEPLGIYALEKAIEIYKRVLNGEKDLDEVVKSIISKGEKIYLKNKVGPSTEAILESAKRHDIPFRHLMKDYSLYTLGWGSKKKRIWGPVTSETSMLSSDIAQNKFMTKTVLQNTGFSVPEGEIVTSKEEALESAKRLNFPLIIKPVDGHHGEGVVGDIVSEEEVEEAYEISKDCSDKLLLEEHIPGDDFRFLVIDHEMKAAAKRIPPHVIGDGGSTIEELVEEVNQDPRRSEGHQSVLTNIRLGREEKRFLRTRGFIPESVPDQGQKVYLRVGGNLSTGGISEDYTERVHPKLKKLIENASRVIGMDLAGIDIISEDVTADPDEVRWGIIEVNASPGLRMHTDPALGTSIDVGEYVIDHLYPDKDARIPLVAVTGTNGKTITSRIIEWLARDYGYHTGMTVTGDIYLDGEQIVEGGTTRSWHTRAILDNPDVEYAVLETARGEILKKGLSFDKSKVSVVTNIQEDHLGLDGVETLEDIFHIKSLILETTGKDGYCVLNGNDDFSDKLMERCNGTPFVFAVDKDDKVESYIKRGIKTLTIEGTKIVLYESGDRKVLVDIDDIPYMMGGVRMFLENTLAALCASHASGIPMGSVIESLKNLVMDEDIIPKRVNTFKYDESLIVMDYAHNIDGIRALGDFTDHLPGGRKVIALTVPGDRSDDFIMKCGRVAAELFDMVICTENEEVIRGRSDGEICNLVAKGVLDNGGKVPITISDKYEAVEFVIENRRPGDRLIFADLDITSEELSDVLSENGFSAILEPFKFDKEN